MCTSTFTESQSLARRIGIRISLEKMYGKTCHEFHAEYATRIFENQLDLSLHDGIQVIDRLIDQGSPELNFINYCILYFSCFNQGGNLRILHISFYFYIWILFLPHLNDFVYCAMLEYSKLVSMNASIALLITFYSLRAATLLRFNGISAVNRARIFNPISQNAPCVACSFFSLTITEIFLVSFFHKMMSPGRFS